MLNQITISSLDVTMIGTRRLINRNSPRDKFEKRHRFLFAKKLNLIRNRPEQTSPKGKVAFVAYAEGRDDCSAKFTILGSLSLWRFHG